jgi:hypothetical protein
LNVATKFFDRWSSFLLAFGVVMCLESLCTIEWSFPYCSSQEDGPAAAVFGMPFPYIRWAGASSLEYDFMPLVYALNVLVLFALAWPLTRLLLWSFVERRSGIRTALGTIGLALTLVVLAGIAFLIGVGAWQPTASIGLYGQDTYFDLRPLWFTINDLHYECTPSPKVSRAPGASFSELQSDSGFHAPSTGDTRHETRTPWRVVRNR